MSIPTSMSKSGQLYVVNVRPMSDPDYPIWVTIPRIGWRTSQAASQFISALEQGLILHNYIIPQPCNLSPEYIVSYFVACIWSCTHRISRVEGQLLDIQV